MIQNIFWQKDFLKSIQELYKWSAEFNDKNNIKNLVPLKEIEDYKTLQPPLKIKYLRRKDTKQIYKDLLYKNLLRALTYINENMQYIGDFFRVVVIINEKEPFASEICIFYKKEYWDSIFNRNIRKNGYREIIYKKDEKANLQDFYTPKEFCSEVYIQTIEDKEETVSYQTQLLVIYF